jgi:hypothetical protein
MCGGESKREFRKILVSHYSPQNKCFAGDGAVLFVPPVPEKPKKHGTTQYFVSSQDRNKISKFGWVKSVEKFDMSYFLETYKIDPSPQQIEIIDCLLTSITNLADDTPVAATWFNRGVERRRPELSFHRVFFTPEGRAAQDKLKTFR